MAQFEDIVETLKRSAAHLREAEVPHLVGGGLASWAHGGPESCKDVDFIVRERDAERALEALASHGMKPERPPEGWLLKAHDGDITVDLIYAPSGGPDLEELFERSEELSVMAQPMRVMDAADVVVTKLHALDQHNADFTSLLEIVRALREQIDWDRVRRQTAGSPFASAFFTLAEELDILPRAAEAHERRIRVAPAAGSDGGNAERRTAP